MLACLQECWQEQARAGQGGVGQGRCVCEEGGGGNIGCHIVEARRTLQAVTDLNVPMILDWDLADGTAGHLHLRPCVRRSVEGAR